MVYFLNAFFYKYVPTYIYVPRSPQAKLRDIFSYFEYS